MKNPLKNMKFFYENPPRKHEIFFIKTMKNFYAKFL